MPGMTTLAPFARMTTSLDPFDFEASPLRENDCFLRLSSLVCKLEEPFFRLNYSSSFTPMSVMASFHVSLFSKLSRLPPP